MDDHMKNVAARNADKTENQFYNVMRRAGWYDNEIKQMWEYAQRRKKENAEIH